jgi:hypothetical protein
MLQLFNAPASAYTYNVLVPRYPLPSAIVQYSFLCHIKILNFLVLGSQSEPWKI